MSRVQSILFVEDEINLRNMVCEALETDGYLVHCVETAVEAIMELKSPVVFDALITDFDFPDGMTGLNLASAARAAYPDMVIIVVSGHPRESVGALPPGAVYLQKPYRISQLVAALGDQRHAA